MNVWNLEWGSLNPQVAALTSKREASVVTSVDRRIKAVGRIVSLPTTYGTGSFIMVFLEVQWTGNNKFLLVSL